MEHDYTGPLVEIWFHLKYGDEKSGAWSGSAFQHRRSTPSDLARVPHSLRRIPFVELAFTNLMAMMRLLSHQKHSGLKHDF